MRSSSNSGIRNGDSYSTQEKDEKRDHSNSTGAALLYVVGIGPGHGQHLSLRAHSVLKNVDTVIGYTTYIDLIRDLISDKNILSTGMRKEIDRVHAAISIAQQGTSCALISSGDSGIYAMASLVLEVCDKKGIPIIGPHDEGDPKQNLCLEIVPGIPALASGASLLGAPLSHDFACISLSTLLTPWDIIEKRISHAAEADFVIVLFNPKSKKRHWQLEETQKIILKYRNEKTPVGITKNIMRQNQEVIHTTLGILPKEDIDMQSTVFIGNSHSVKFGKFMYTPRGYSEKYRLDLTE